MISNIAELDAYIDQLYNQARAATGFPAMSREIQPLFVLWRQGQALEGAGDFERAIPHYKKALQVEPGFANARFAWGRCLQALGRLPEALAQYRATVAINPDDLAVYMQIAQVQASMGDVPGEISAYQQALSIEPGYFPALLNLGIVTRQTGDLQHSAETLQAAYNLVQDRLPEAGERALEIELRKVSFELARTRFSRQEMEQAEALFLNVIELAGRSLSMWADPHHNKAAYLSKLFLARIALRRADHATALALLGECLQIEPQDSLAALLLGNAMAGGGDPLPLTFLCE